MSWELNLLNAVALAALFVVVVGSAHFVVTTRADARRRLMSGPSRGHDSASRPEWSDRARLRIRRRLATGALLATTLCYIVGGARALGADGVPAHSQALVRAQTYQVRAGDTLWSIAGRLSGGGDRRSVITMIIDGNDLAGSTLEPGTLLVLPGDFGEPS